MEKLSALFAVFRKGETLANPDAWRHGQIAANVVTAFLVAVLNLSSAFGYSVPIPLDVLNAFGVSIVGIVNFVLGIATSATAGLPSKSSAQDKTDTGTNYPSNG